jgi:hypothetical protein
VKKYNFREYVEEARKMEDSLLQGENSIERIESDFWKYCHNSNGEGTQVETKYAADHSYSYFLKKEDFSEISDFLEKANTWNLSSIYKEPNSMFQFLKTQTSHHISGLTQPWVYFGMLFSTFCWHVEDLYMYSLNYMYYGKPKIWYSVSHNQKEKLDQFILNRKLSLDSHDPYILHKLILLVDPSELVQNGIEVFRAVQYPGDVIVTLPKAYHAGFSTGFNIAEAVNIAVRENFC